MSRVLVTRDPASSRELTGLLRDRGYNVRVAPLLEAQLPEDTTALRSVLERAARPQVPTWLTVTSANTVLALAAVASDPGWGGALERARASTPRLSVAAVGRATASALRKAGIGVDFTPQREQSAAGMLAEWPDASASTGEAALVPASELASPTLADGLTERGYEVSTAVAYRMVPAPAATRLHTDVGSAQDPPVLAADAARDQCARGEFGAVVATAPSRVAALLDDQPRPPDETKWVAIGEPTAAALRLRGLAPVVADDPSPVALVAAVDRALEDVLKITSSTEEKTS